MVLSFDGFVGGKYLVYENRVTQLAGKELPALHAHDNISVWSDRYILSSKEEDDNYFQLTFFDLFMNESRQACFRKSTDVVYYIEICLLENGFGLIVERCDEYCVSLVQTVWSAGEFRFVDQFKCERQSLDILVDPLKPTKLVLLSFNDDEANTMWSYQMCNVVGFKFQFLETRQLKTKFHQYSNGKLIGFKRQEQKFLITSYDWTTKQEQVTEIDFVPERFKFIHHNGLTSIQHCLDSFFSFQQHMRGFGLGNFHGTMKLFNGNFIVSTQVKTRRNFIVNSKVKIFSIPIQRPNLLRNSAWMLLVNTMKRKGGIDPYAAAKKYLPLNTDLRSVWFEDKDEKSSNGQSESEQSESNESSQELDDNILAKRVKPSFNHV